MLNFICGIALKFNIICIFVAEYGYLPVPPYFKYYNTLISRTRNEKRQRNF